MTRVVEPAHADAERRYAPTPRRTRQQPRLVLVQPEAVRLYRDAPLEEARAGELAQPFDHLGQQQRIHLAGLARRGGEDGQDVLGGRLGRVRVGQGGGRARPLNTRPPRRRRAWCNRDITVPSGQLAIDAMSWYDSPSSSRSDSTSR